MTNITVLIPVFNDQQGLIKSLSSIVNSTLKVSILIVDDGSQPPIIIQEKDYQLDVTLIRLSKNSGIEVALNKGIEYLQRNKAIHYIARLDSGDTVLPNRFRIQSDFLDANKDIGLVGTFANIINIKGELMFIQKYPETHEQIIKELYYQNQFCHPSTMFRNSLFANGLKYPINYKYAEDYALFLKISQNYKTANIGEPLINYSIDPNSISSTKRIRQSLARLNLQLKYFNAYNIHSYLGIVRTILLLLLPRNFSTTVKKLAIKGQNK